MKSKIGKPSFALIIFSVGVVLAGCSQGPLALRWPSDSKILNSAPNSKTTVSLDNRYKEVAFAVLKNNCSSCHGDSSGAHDVYGLNDASHLTTSGLVVPGSPETSPLYEVIVSGDMPPGRKLSDGDIESLQKWILGSNETPPESTPIPGPTPLSPEALMLENSYKPAAIAIFKSKCASCHGDCFEDTAYLLSDKLVVPGSPDQSELYRMVFSNEMPPDAPLTTGEIETLRNWIGNAPAQANPSPTPSATPTVTPSPSPSPTPNPTATPSPTPSPTPDSSPSPSPSPTPDPGGSTTAPPTFQQLNAAILAPKCLRCHSGPKPAHGVSYESYDDAIKTVDVANPTGSKMYKETFRQKMPPKNPLASDEVDMILQWIQAGAPNN